MTEEKGHEGEDGDPPSLLVILWMLFVVVMTVFWLVQFLRNPLKAFGDNWNGFWGGWKAAVDLSVAFAPILGMAICVTLALTVATVLLALVASIRRLRRARVFISYHHPLEAQAKALAGALEAAGIRALRVQFRDKPEHDFLLDDIYRMARQADLVVCLPGTVPSFVESEVAVASSSGKPIIFILPEHHKGLPDTGYRSYPVMKTVEAQDGDYERLIAFIRHLWGSPLATWQLLARLTPPPMLVFVWSLVVLMLVLTVVVAVTTAWSFTYLFANLHDQAFVGAFKNGGLTFLIVAMAVSYVTLIVAVSPVVAVGYRWMTRWTLQRRINKGDYSYAVFKPLLAGCGLGNLNACFFEVAPPSRHQTVKATVAEEQRGSNCGPSGGSGGS